MNAERKTHRQAGREKGTHGVLNTTNHIVPKVHQTDEIIFETDTAPSARLESDP